MAIDETNPFEVERTSSVDDQATLIEERERAAALAAHAARAAAAVRLPGGVCANCQEPLAPTEHFCDASCRNDFERRAAARARNGT